MPHERLFFFAAKVDIDIRMLTYHRLKDVVGSPGAQACQLLALEVAALKRSDAEGKHSRRC